MQTVFFDVDTQIDFVYPAGSLYVPGAERILSTVARLNHWAAGHGIPLVSTMDAHPENDPEFRVYPPHCVVGTVGQQKPAATLTGRQHFVLKQKFDCFTSPDLPPLLDSLRGDRFAVYGVVTEICVMHAAMGLVSRGARVELIEDAVMHLDGARRDESYAKFRAAGGRIVHSGDVL
ncbi:MAG: cysteine hydrolase [Acidobacteria bacterium]|nr:cysteine hydrolase [Acidobacteriota bacterium]